MTICSKCGFDSDLGHIFCHSCGARLDLSAVKAPSPLTKKAGGEPVRFVKYTISVLIALAVVTAVYLAAGMPTSVRSINATGQGLKP